MAVSSLLVGWLLGCAGLLGTAETVPPDVPAEATTSSERVVPVEIAAAPPTASSLYEGCRVRVEGAETSGECATDADCARTGCSGEVCVASASAGDVVTTCEVLPCFAALDACGCHEGVCGWTLKEPALRKFPLPLPVTPAQP